MTKSIFEGSFLQEGVGVAAPASLSLWPELCEDVFPRSDPGSDEISKHEVCDLGRTDLARFDSDRDLPELPYQLSPEYFYDFRHSLFGTGSADLLSTADLEDQEIRTRAEKKARSLLQSSHDLESGSDKEAVIPETGKRRQSHQILVRAAGSDLGEACSVDSSSQKQGMQNTERWPSDRLVEQAIDQSLQEQSEDVQPELESSTSLSLQTGVGTWVAAHPTLGSQDLEVLVGDLGNLERWLSFLFSLS